MNDTGFVDIYPASWLRNVPLSVQSTLQRVQKQEWSGVFRTGTRVPTDPMTVQSVLKWVEEPEVRTRLASRGAQSKGFKIVSLVKLISTIRLKSDEFSKASN